jgi:hypothetical protein
MFLLIYPTFREVITKLLLHFKHLLLLPSEAMAATYSWRRLQFLLVPDPRATYVF